jgi:hypothetical protein
MKIFYFQCNEQKLNLKDFELMFFKIDFDNLEIFIHDFKDIELIYENLMYLIYFFERSNKLNEISSKKFLKKILKNIQN